MMLQHFKTVLMLRRKKVLVRKRCTQNTESGLWLQPSGQPVCSHALFHVLADVTHGPTHEGKEQINEIIRSQWLASGVTQVVHTLVDSCMTCPQIRKKGSSIRHDHFPPPLGPFIKSLVAVLEFAWQLRVPYHPQSSGQV